MEVRRSPPLRPVDGIRVKTCVLSPDFGLFVRPSEVDLSLFAGEILTEIIQSEHGSINFVRFNFEVSNRGKAFLEIDQSMRALLSLAS